MSFALLVLLIILIIIVSATVVTKNHKKSQLDFSTKTGIENNNKNTSNSNTYKQNSIDLETLPSAFQQIILDIEVQFFTVISLNDNNKITPDLWFNAKKMFYDRLPEIVNDYMRLDDSFARNESVDQQQKLTSYDIALHQLKSIMGYFHQINCFNEQKHIQKMLVNQRYLSSIYSESGLSNQMPNIDFNHQYASIFVSNAHDKQDNFLDSDYTAGQNYLDDYCTMMPKLKRSSIAEIGKFIYLASITQIAVQDYLENELSKLNISSEYGLESLEVLLIHNIPTTLSNVHAHPSIEKTLFVNLTSICELLEHMLKILDKDIRLDIKLNQLKDIDTKIWKIINKDWM